MSGFFIIDYIINLLENININIPVIGKTWWTHFENEISMSLYNLCQNNFFKEKMFLIKSINVLVWRVIGNYWKLKLSCVFGAMNKLVCVRCVLIWIILLYWIFLTWSLLLLMNPFGRDTQNTLETMSFCKYNMLIIQL